MSTFSTAVSTSIASFQNYSQADEQSPSSASIIRLVNSEKSSRPFLFILKPPHLNIPNFDELIKVSPFKQHSAVNTPKVNRRQCSFKIPSSSCDTSPKESQEDSFAICSLRRNRSSDGSFKGVLKNQSKSRFWKGK